jgi:hypothetical protein
MLTGGCVCVLVEGVSGVQLPGPVVTRDGLRCHARRPASAGRIIIIIIIIITTTTTTTTIIIIITTTTIPLQVSEAETCGSSYRTCLCD